MGPVNYRHTTRSPQARSRAIGRAKSTTQAKAAWKSGGTWTPDDYRRTAHEFCSTGLEGRAGDGMVRFQQTMQDHDAATKIVDIFLEGRIT